MPRPRSFSILLLLLAATLLAPTNLQAQDSQERRDRIAENLKYRFEQLRDASVAVVALSDAGIPGMSMGTLMINGQNQMRFLVNADDTSLFLLAADPVDVSMTEEELAAERERIAQAGAVEAQERHAQLLALSQGAPSLGPDDAPVTIVEFSDFQCPFCARVVPTIKELLAKYPDQVRLVFMDFPLNIHPWAEPAAIAAGCVAGQSNEAFWNLHDYYFENQEDITPENVIDRSRSVILEHDVNSEEWETCARDPASEVHSLIRGRMQMSMRVAQSFGASGTPTFFINGRFISGAQPLEALEELVQQALAD